MIITNALVACCEVVIDRKSTSGPRGSSFNDLVGAHTYKGEYLKVTPYGSRDKLNQLTYASGSFSCIILYGTWTILRRSECLDIGVVMLNPEEGLE
jgi:hypothetical protein